MNPASPGDRRRQHDLAKHAKRSLAQIASGLKGAAVDVLHRSPDREEDVRHEDVCEGDDDGELVEEEKRERTLEEADPLQKPIDDATLAKNRLEGVDADEI